MRALNLLIPALAALALTACASGKYTAPPPPAFETQKTVAQPYDAAFDAVLNGAPALGYKVLTASREQGEIRLRFGAQAPESYIECGRFVGSTGTTSFRGDWVRWVTNMRTAQVTGLMVVRLRPLNPGETEAVVRAGYSLTLPASVAPAFAGADFTFASDSSKTVTILDALASEKERTCQPSGKAEAEMLGLIG